MGTEEKNGITLDNTFQLTFYDYGTPFYGSYMGMRYRIAREPLENVYGKSKEIKEQGRLVAIVWSGPEAFEFASEEEKITADFPYTVEGKEEAIQWLNEQYIQQKERWLKIYNMYR